MPYGEELAAAMAKILETLQLLTDQDDAARICTSLGEIPALLEKVKAQPYIPLFVHGISNASALVTAGLVLRVAFVDRHKEVQIAALHVASKVKELFVGCLIEICFELQSPEVSVRNDAMQALRSGRDLISDPDMLAVVDAAISLHLA